MMEILTDWEFPGTSGGTSVMFFDDTSVSVGAARTALADFWGNFDGSLASGVEWTIRTEGRVLDEATGGLVGFWTSTTPYTAVATGGSTPVPNASQALIQWYTSDVVAGRRVRGRQYIPGLSSALTVQGELSTSVQATLNGHITTYLADPNNALVIWHRPVAGSGGSIHSVSSGKIWDELAVQRKRRD